MTEQSAHKRRSVDWLIIGVYLLLVLIGWVNIYAATHASEAGSILNWSSRAGKQFVWILTSLSLAGIILYVIPARWWEGLSIPLYFVVLGLLVLVIFVSSDVKGSHSWFDLGPIRFQPAEISKISTSLLLSYLISQPGFKMSRRRDFLLAAAIIGLPMLVIIGESETGSALVYAGFIFVLYRAGLSGWWLAAIGLVILLFVGTLTLGAYWPVLMLAVVLTFVNAFEVRSRMWRRIGIGLGFVVVMSALPFLMDGVYAHVQQQVDLMSTRFWVPQAGESETYRWAFLLKVKPVYLLLAACAGMLPYIGRYAVKNRDGFLMLSIVVFLVGVLMVFSTDYIFQNVLQPHQRVRIEVLLGMKEDPAGVGYNVNQSKIAIGSGGLLGKGFLQGTQTTFGFVPEQSTDFIFCTVGEEWGFVGCLVVIGLYLFLIARLMTDAESCRGTLTRTYGYCVAACIFMHLFINVGMTVGLMPVIGIPLPLLSYGGSSLWAFTILIFIFLALYREEKKYF